MSELVASGSLLLAVPIAALAGLVSFLSPCVLPLVPGYLSYVTGMSDDPRRGRLVLGTTLFVAGFGAVFVLSGALFGQLGQTLLVNADLITRVLGVLTIVLGLAFLGVFPWLMRDVRIHKVPAAGLAGAPLLGVVFGLGWTSCIVPTLAVVLTLGLNAGSAPRGALVAAALAYSKALRTFRAIRKHSRLITRIGGGMMVAVGLALVTGLWGEMIAAMQGLIGGFRPVI